MQTVYQLIPETDEASQWIEDNVQYEDYQRMGNAVCVEHRYINDLVAGMIANGFALGKDFSVR